MSMNTKNQTEMRQLNKDIRKAVLEFLGDAYPDLIFSMDNVETSYAVSDLHPKGFRISSRIVITAIPYSEDPEED